MKSFSKKQPLTALVIVCMISSTVMVSVPKTGDSLFLPFGGTVSTFFPGCVSPVGIALTTVGAKPQPLIYLPGSSYSYSYGPPTRPGQKILGMATIPTPCMIWQWVPGGLFVAGYYILVPYPGQPMGFAIWYHGASL